MAVNCLVSALEVVYVIYLVVIFKYIAFCFLKKYLTIIVAQRLSKTNYS